ncbi:hypothetical protein GPECTOR_12g553 [Gonium pectorale]|uniref:Uncharacterized protein n=1 Tax=Gonium pectorale TaxID=33097 RepID=A0A150GP23_GONPE|nr:hypothetical protein GPECTOR_12g553 [Gonium pectorale]|eukprot:KXZ51589.1 hypothetical protein GPECTOR_12g553 [Gonium pectorale]
MPPARCHFGLIDTLAQVGVAARTLVEILQAEEYKGSLRNLRSACRGLRACVDGNVVKLSLRVKQHHLQLWDDGELPSLQRWPSCSSVVLELDPECGPDDGAVDLSLLAAVPFLDMPLAARERIREIQICTAVDDEDYYKPLPDGQSWQVEAAVCTLATLLPGLRTLDLASLKLMSMDLRRQRLMYNTLANHLPRLDLLCLPSLFCLKCAGALAEAGSAPQTIQVDYSEIFRDTAEDADFAHIAEGVAKLHGLRKLQVHALELSVERRAEAGDGAGEAVGVGAVRGNHSGPSLLRLLLNSLPPSLEELSCVSVNNLGLGATYSKFHLHLRGGIAQSLVFDNDWEIPPDDFYLLAPMARDLLGSRVMGPQLDLLKHEFLRVCQDEHVRAPELQPLWELVVQEAWDGHVSRYAGSPASELALLRLLLRGWEQLVGGLPPMVRFI